MSFVIMGCSPSTLDTDPNVMYGQKKTFEQNNNDSKVKSTNNYNSNGIQNGAIPNGHVSIMDKNTKDQINKTIQEDTTTSVVDKTIKGDLSKWTEAKYGREQRLKERQAKRDKMAQVMSERVMEEKERLSLVSSRSRMTSRATSRATSPRQSRVNGSCCENLSNSATGSRQSSVDLHSDDVTPSTSQNGQKKMLAPDNQNACNNNTDINNDAAPFSGGEKCVKFKEDDTTVRGS